MLIFLTSFKCSLGDNKLVSTRARQATPPTETQKRNVKDVIAHVAPAKTMGKLAIIKDVKAAQTVFPSSISSINASRNVGKGFTFHLAKSRKRHAKNVPTTA